MRAYHDLLHGDLLHALQAFLHGDTVHMDHINRIAHGTKRIILVPSIIPNVKRNKLTRLPDRRRDLQQASCQAAVRLYRAIHPNQNGRYAMRDPSGAAAVEVSVEELRLRRYSRVKGLHADPHAAAAAVRVCDMQGLAADRGCGEAVAAIHLLMVK